MWSSQSRPHSPEQAIPAQVVIGVTGHPARAPWMYIEQKGEMFIRSALPGPPLLARKSQRKIGDMQQSSSRQPIRQRVLIV